MRHLRISLFFLLLLYNTSCINSKERQNQSAQLQYDEAIEIANQYLIDSGFHKHDENYLLYDPKSAFWNSYSSSTPEMLEEYGLKNRNYHAILFLGKSPRARDGGATVFVDKDERQIIGILYDNDFVKISDNH